MIRFSAFPALVLLLSGCSTLYNPEIVRRYEGFGEDTRSEEIFESVRGRRSPDEIPSALAVLRDLIAKFPENIRVHREYQDRMAQAGQQKDLQKEYRLRLEQRRTPANFYLSARAETNPEESARLLRESISPDYGGEKNFYWGYYGLASHFREEGEQEGAKKTLTVALEINPEFLEGLWKRAEIYESEDRDIAIDAWKDYLKHAPWDLAARYNLGVLYMRAEKPKAGRNQFEVILRKEPGNFDALYAIADSYVLAEDPIEAVQIYRQILDRDSKQVLAHYNLGILYEQNLHDTPAALREYQTFYEMTAESNDNELIFKRIQVGIWIDALKGAATVPVPGL